MDGMEQAKTVEDVRRAARKALSRLSRTFGEWETLISTLKADLSDQQSLTLELREKIKQRPTDEQIEFLNGEIDSLKINAKKYKEDRKLAVQNRNSWKAESSRLQKDLKKKVKEISRLEATTGTTDRTSRTEFPATADAVIAELETEKTFSREQAEQIGRLRKDLIEMRTERQALERKLDQLQSSLDKRDRDHDSFDVNEEKTRELRSELEQAREQQEKSGSALEANKQVALELRDELELARKQLSELSEMEGALQKADEKVGELRKKIDSLEFNNRALKKGTDLFLKEKVKSRSTISGLKETVEEMKVKVRKTEAHLAKAQAGEEPTGDATLSMSAIQSRDIRFQVQNEELRVKLGKQRQRLDEVEELVKGGERRYKDLKASNEAQQALIEELQDDIDNHNKVRGEDRRSDVKTSQLKARLEEKEKLIESLQTEILNQTSGGMKKPKHLDARDATKNFKLNADQLEPADPVISKDQQILVAELRTQLMQKDVAMKAVRKALADLRDRFQKLANKDRADQTVEMPKPDLTGADESSMVQASADESDADWDGSGTIAKTVQIRRPEFD